MLRFSPKRSDFLCFSPFHPRRPPCPGFCEKCKKTQAERSAKRVHFWLPPGEAVERSETEEGLWDKQRFAGRLFCHYTPLPPLRGTFPRGKAGASPWLRTPKPPLSKGGEFAACGEQGGFRGSSTGLTGIPPTSLRSATSLSQGRQALRRGCAPKAPRRFSSNPSRRDTLLLHSSLLPIT